MSQYAFFPPHLNLSPLDWYQSLQDQPGFIDDPQQKLAMERLELLYQALMVLKKKRQSFFGRWLSRPAIPRGVYLYGGVGRGKTFLMDTFFACVPYLKKRRVHFHAFMREVQEELTLLQGHEDPLLSIADKIAKTTHLLCFDEFHVSDIADAMVLGRLLTALFRRGIVLVMTSNYPPDQLYLNGLQRINFLPTIELLKEKLEIVALSGSVDYRLRVLARARTWLTPINHTTNETLDYLFTQLSSSKDLPHTLIINGRSLSSVRHTQGVVWFTFAELCKTARSQMDYLALTQDYHTLFISDIPYLHQEDADAARRFTWLIDILYNARVKLIASSDTTPEFLYLKGKKADEFARIRSRLEEMQSNVYLELTHLS